jgi:hypothetical protein
MLAFRSLKPISTRAIALSAAKRAFSSCIVAHNIPTSLHTFTEDELMLRESGMGHDIDAFLFQPVAITMNNFFTVADFAQNIIKPLVPQMEEEEQMPSELISNLFEHGVSY